MTTEARLTVFVMSCLVLLGTVNGLSLDRKARSTNTVSDIETPEGRALIVKHFQRMVASNKKSDVPSLMNDCRLMCTFCYDQGDFYNADIRNNEPMMNVYDESPLMARYNEQAYSTCVYSCLIVREPLAAIAMDYQFTDTCYRCFQDIAQCGM